jgi:hypothetical protein
MFPMRDVESCEGHEPRAIAFERHECGILRKKSFDSIGINMQNVKVGKHFVTVYPTTFPNSVAQIVDPATNTDGVYLQTATLVTAGGTLNLYTGKVAPTRIGDPVAAGIFGGVDGGNSRQYQLSYPLFIPAGYGLWASANTAGAAIALTWDFVS